MNAQRYSNIAAELRELAGQMRWAENRDHLLQMAEKLTEMVEPTSDRSGAFLVPPVSPTENAEPN